MKENLPPVMLSNLICVCTSTYWQNVYATGSYKQVIPTKACLIKIKNKKIDPYQSYRKGLFTLVTLITIEYAWWPSKKTIEPYQSCHKGLCTLVMPDTTEYAGRPALVLHVTLPDVELQDMYNILVHAECNSPLKQWVCWVWIKNWHWFEQIESRGDQAFLTKKCSFCLPGKASCPQ